MSEQITLTNNVLYICGQSRLENKASWVNFLQMAEWLARRLDIESTIEILFDDKFCDENDVRGASNEIADGSYMMVLDPYDEDIVLVLCHEFVHLWQLEFEKLRYINEDDIYYWEGAPYDPASGTLVPWEVEADKLESVLYAELEKALPR